MADGVPEDHKPTDWVNPKVCTVKKPDDEKLGMTLRKDLVIKAIADNSPAAKAGLEPWMLVTAVNGKAVATTKDVSANIGKSNEYSITAKVHVSKARAGPKVAVATGAGTQDIVIKKAKFEDAGIKLNSELVIVYLDFNGPAAKAGVQRGCTLLQVNGEIVTDPTAAVDAITSAETVELKLKEGKQKGGKKGAKGERKGGKGYADEYAGGEKGGKKGKGAGKKGGGFAGKKGGWKGDPRYQPYGAGPEAWQPQGLPPPPMPMHMPMPMPAAPVPPGHMPMSPPHPQPPNPYMAGPGGYPAPPQPYAHVMAGGPPPAAVRMPVMPASPVPATPPPPPPPAPTAPASSAAFLEAVEQRFPRMLPERIVGAYQASDYAAWATKSIGDLVVEFDAIGLDRSMAAVVQNIAKNVFCSAAPAPAPATPQPMPRPHPQPSLPMPMPAPAPAPPQAQPVARYESRGQKTGARLSQMCAQARGDDVEAHDSYLTKWAAAHTKNL